MTGTDVFCLYMGAEDQKSDSNTCTISHCFIFLLSYFLRSRQDVLFMAAD